MYTQSHTHQHNTPSLSLVSPLFTLSIAVACWLELTCGKEKGTVDSASSLKNAQKKPTHKKGHGASCTPHEEKCGESSPKCEMQLQLHSSSTELDVFVCRSVGFIPLSFNLPPSQPPSLSTSLSLFQPPSLSTSLSLNLVKVAFNQLMPG